MHKLEEITEDLENTEHRKELGEACNNRIRTS